MADGVDTGKLTKRSLNTVPYIYRAGRAPQIESRRLTCTGQGVGGQGNKVTTYRSAPERRTCVGLHTRLTGTQ